MLRRKRLVLGFLVFCLAATLLIGVTSSAEYDPWLDYNDDAAIDIFDIVSMAGAFGTSGDPTKPVVIAGRSVEENAIDFVVEYDTHVNITIPTAGFRTMTVGIFAYALTSTYFEVFIGYRVANRYLNSSTLGMSSDSGIIIIDPEKPWYENIRGPKISWTEEVWFSELVLVINHTPYPFQEQPLTVSVVYYLST